MFMDPHALLAGEVFKLNNSPAHRPKGLVISASFFEIYCSKVFDLLNEKKRLKILEDRQGKVQVGMTNCMLLAVVSQGFSACTWLLLIYIYCIA